MAKEPLITEAMRQAIGTRSAPVVVPVEKGAIRRFAEAIEDPNPIYQEEIQARRSRYGSIIAPPTFLRSIRVEPLPLLLETPLNRTLDGGSEWEYYHPVRPGDTITAVTELADLAERTSRTIGAMLIVTNETTYTNQLGQVVARQRRTRICY